MNQHAKYLGQWTFSSEGTVQTHAKTHAHAALIALPGPLKWSEISTAKRRQNYRIIIHTKVMISINCTLYIKSIKDWNHV